MRNYTKPANRMLITYNHDLRYWTIVKYENRVQTYVRRAIHFWFVAEHVAKWQGKIYWRYVR